MSDFTTNAASLQYDCGASLPLQVRATDIRYRRVCTDRLRWATPRERLELRTFLELLPVRWARHIFLWNAESLALAKRLADEEFPDHAMHEHNLHSLNADVVKALIEAMKYGGWSGKGQLPDVVRMGLRAKRDEGLNIQEIADFFGLGYWTVSYGFRTPTKARMARKKVGLVL